MLDSMFYGITAKNFRVLAYEFAEKNDIDHQFNIESKIAGKEWYRCFMKAHKDIVLRQPTSTSMNKKEKTCFCPSCHEVCIEPVSEDWIQCYDCLKWWHEKCTSYSGLGQFFCDLCN